MSRRRRPAEGLVVSGIVLRTAKEGNFVLRTPDGTEHELLVEAVEDFKVLGGSAGLWLCQLSRGAKHLGPGGCRSAPPSAVGRRLGVALEKAPQATHGSSRARVLARDSPLVR